MEEQKKSDSDNLKNALCYIPLIALVLFFTEENKSIELKKHIKYWAIILGWYIILQTILGSFLAWILFIVYIGISGFLFFKAYQWQDVNLEHIDNLEKKIQDEFGSSKK